MYTVEKAWYTGGMSGFMVWKFALKRCKDQAPPPWEFAEDLKDGKAVEESDIVDKDTENCKIENDKEQTNNKKEMPEVEDNKEAVKDDKCKDVLKESQGEKWNENNQTNPNEEVDDVKVEKNEESEEDKNVSAAEQVDETECKPEINVKSEKNNMDPQKQENSSGDEQRNDFNNSILKSTDNENHGKDGSEIETMDKVDGTDQVKTDYPEPAAAEGGEDEKAI